MIRSPHADIIAVHTSFHQVTINMTQYHQRFAGILTYCHTGLAVTMARFVNVWSSHDNSLFPVLGCFCLSFEKKWRSWTKQWDVTSWLQNFGPLKHNQLKQPTSHTQLLGFPFIKVLKKNDLCSHRYWLILVWSLQFFDFCHHYYKLGLILASTGHCSEVVFFPSW